MSGRKIFVSSDMSVDERLLLVSERNGMAALLWPWLLTAFDDWGRCEASPLRLKARIWPMNDAVSVADISEALNLFSEVELIVRYTVAAHDYLCVPPERWWRWQTHIHRDKRESDGSRLPAPDGDESRGVARSRAESRGVARDSVPSPTPSPSPPPSGSDTPTSLTNEDLRQRQQRARAHTHEEPPPADANPADAAPQADVADPNASMRASPALRQERLPDEEFLRQFADAADLPAAARGQALDAIIAEYRPRAPDGVLIVEAYSFREFYPKRPRNNRLLANWMATWWTRRQATIAATAAQPQREEAHSGQRQHQQQPAAASSRYRGAGRRFDPPDPTANGRWSALFHDGADDSDDEHSEGG